MDGFGAALGVGGVPANSPNRSTASTGEREPPNVSIDLGKNAFTSY